MKIFARKKLLIVGVLLVLAASGISAHNVQNRRNEVMVSSSRAGDLSISSIVSQLGNIPLIGPYLMMMMNFISEAVQRMNNLTNGAITRLAGGMLPCEVSRQSGIVCTGVSKNGGVFGMISKMIDELPIPEMAKQAMKMFISMVINPVVDTLFGGVPES